MLKKQFFEIPTINRTADLIQIKKWHQEWLACELFENLPCDGLVVKVNSGEVKGKLVVNSKTLNWPFALK